jgi:hypothetical protein
MRDLSYFIKVLANFLCFGNSLPANIERFFERLIFEVCKPLICPVFNVE